MANQQGFGQLYGKIAPLLVRVFYTQKGEERSYYSLIEKTEDICPGMCFHVVKVSATREDLDLANHILRIQEENK